MDEKNTKPTIETVLNRMSAMEERLSVRMDERFDAMEQRLYTRMDERLSGMDQRLNKLDERMILTEQRINQRMSKMEERLDSRLDRIESVANTTRGEMLELRADFRDLRSQIREQFSLN